MSSEQHAHKHVRRGTQAEPDRGGSAQRNGGGIVTALTTLQAAAGNAATQHLIQTKLSVGSASDPLEREADRVAAQVVASERGSNTAAASASVSPATGAVARSTGADGHAGHDVVGLEGGAAPAAAEQAIAKAGGGQKLPGGIQRSMESVTGADLSDVRVHTGSASDTAAQHLQARAFTTGKDIHLAAGEFNPSSKAGRELLAHEATHTIQQDGGSAAARQVVQRMPSPRAVKTRTGRDAKKGVKLFGKSLGGATKTYNALLGAVEAHSRYIMATEIAPDLRGGMAQVAHIGRLVDGVVAAAQTYMAKDDGDASIVALCHELVANANLEKRVAADVLGHWVRKSRDMGGMTYPKWFSQLPDDPTTHRFKAADTRGEQVTDSGGSGQGANKAVAKVTNTAGEAGFFADDDASGRYEGAEWSAPKGMLEDYGVTGDLQIANRSIAMSRLDKLLNAGVIARTERGLLGDRSGTFQVKADGGNWGENGKGEKANTDDGNLARLLSRLQLIDAIAGQIDRHPGNYFIQYDDSGKVTGVTGIDLDMAWTHDNDEDAKKFDVEAEVDRYPGFSRYVDKELAQRIIALKPDDLRIVLVDLLEPAAIEAAVNRFVKLQGLLQEGATHLLEPKDWNAQIRAKIVAETTVRQVTKQGRERRENLSYFGRDRNAYG